MVYGKLQSIFKFFKGMSALDIVKYLFVGIPILILGFLYLFMAQGDIEKMFNEPLIVGQLLLVLAMPFCYLAMRNICQDLKDRKKRDGLLIPLWILIVYQVSSFNMICSFLIIYGTFQEYGKGMFAIKKLNEIIYVFLTIFLYLPKCPQSLILSALRAFCFCGKPRISRSIFLYFPCQSWLKSW